jgi:putative transposase
LRRLIDREHDELSIAEQCELIGLARSSLYYEAASETEENLRLMRLIDEQYLQRPFFGSRQMTSWLRRQGYVINRKRVQRLMRIMGLESIAPSPRTTVPGSGHRIYPYLLKNLEITKPNQVWGADITYVPLAYGFLYLVAILDWYSRYVVNWRLSNSLDESFCLEALEEALTVARPEIFNTDQGSQFTGQAWTNRLGDVGISISMDGKGRALDNVFVERLWRTVKYEEIYLKAYEGPAECRTGLMSYFLFYNRDRPHQSLGGRTPWEAYEETKRQSTKKLLVVPASRRGVSAKHATTAAMKESPAGPCSAPGVGRCAPRLPPLHKAQPERESVRYSGVTSACHTTS